MKQNNKDTFLSAPWEYCKLLFIYFVSAVLSLVKPLPLLKDSPPPKHDPLIEVFIAVCFIVIAGFGVWAKIASDKDFSVALKVHRLAWHYYWISIALGILSIALPLRATTLLWYTPVTFIFMTMSISIFIAIGLRKPTFAEFAANQHKNADPN